MCALLLLSLLFFFRTTFANDRIAYRKCNEYSKAVYSQEMSPVMLPTTKFNTVSQCGIVEVPLVIGGTRAQPKEFPHMAVIGFGTSLNAQLEWLCGGALISESFVLTAAHCMERREKGVALKVKLGVTDVKFQTNSQEIAIAERILHPDYRPKRKYFDVALAKLANFVTFTPYIRPACINVNSNPTVQSAIAIGFGKQSYDASKDSENLMKVQLQILDRQICANSFSSASDRANLPSGIINSLICAGDMKGGKDTCQGDSGGPLQIVLNTPYCMYSIIGITSFGKFCGFANTPALYTNVGEFATWIEKIVWD